MPAKKKGGKGKKGEIQNQTQVQDELLQINTISVEDHFERVHQHDLRIEAVRENDEFFRDITDKYEDIIVLEEEKRKWEKYVNCDKIPNLESPPDIRTYLYKWYFDEWKIINSTFNWILDVDERSILTQDAAVKDLTWKTLREKVPVKGQFCSYHVEHAVQMISGLEEILKGGKKNLVKFHDELLQVKNEIRNRARNSLDNLSYLILYYMDGNMESIDPISEKYNIQTKPFDIAFWGLKSVPYDFKNRKIFELVIDLEAIQSTVTLPLNVLFDDMLIRGLHMHFDHRSSYASIMDFAEPLPAVRDFKIVLVKEWKLRRQIEQEKLKQMREQRQIYEEELKVQEEEEAKKEEANRKQKKMKSDTKGNKKAKKSIKVKVLDEPPVIGSDTFLNIDDDFIEMDDLKHQRHLEKLRPEFLKLHPNEINLREYVILGGVYEYNFLHKLGQLRQGKSHLIEKEIPAKILYKEFQCNVHYEDRKVDKSLGSRESKLNISAEVQVDELGNPVEEKPEVQLSSLIKINVKLPLNLCRWCTPITCRWSSKIEDVMEQLERESIEKMAVQETNRAIPTVTPDMYMGTVETRKLLYYVIKNQILPRMDSLHQFPDEVAEEKERLQAIANEKDRLRKEAKLDAEVNEKGANTSGRTSVYKEKLIADSTPPATLFPRPTERKEISPKIILDNEEEIKNLSETDRKLLSEYLDELDRLAEARKPQFHTWWSIFNLLNKDQPTSDKCTINDDDRSESERVEHGLEKHGGKSLTKNKFKDTNRLSSKRSISKILNASVKSSPSIDSLARLSSQTAILSKTEFKKLTNEEEVYSTSKGGWFKNGIYKEEFNEEKSEMTFWVDRLGIYGFAYKRYIHFPFKNWAIYPDNKRSDTIVLEIWSPFTNFLIQIGLDGYSADVMMGTQVHARLIQPTSYIHELKAQMESLGLNIFTKSDTCIYVDDISPKHRSLEYHVYQTIAQFCSLYKFSRSKWNWLAHRRVLVMKFGVPEQQSYEMDTIKVTPEESIFCTVAEACTPLDKIVLEYNPTSKNIKFEPNLYALLKSQAGKQTNTNPKVVYLVYILLESIQPLTFCK